MSFFQTRLKKEKRWICIHCNRINDPDEKVCRFCQHTRSDENDPQKIKKQKAYDELVLWPIFSKFIRLRDTDSNGTGRCFTCGRIVSWKGADCGHGVPRQHKGTKYNEQNNHIQCKKCNGFEGGMREEYKVEMDRRYGEGTWNKMLVASRQTFKFGKVEVDMMVEHYNKEIEKLLLTKKFNV